MNTSSLLAMAWQRITRPVLLVTGLVWSLSACGPGVGGTGTGSEPQWAAFGASPAAVCTSSLGMLLCGNGTATGVDTGAVPGGVAGGPGTVPPASVPPLASAAPEQRFADASQRVLVVVRDQTVELQGSCGALRFLGQWGEVPGQPGRWFGTLDRPGGSSLATLQGQAVDGQTLAVTLAQADATVVLGPLVLTRTTRTEPATCP